MHSSLYGACKARLSHAASRSFCRKHSQAHRAHLPFHKCPLQDAGAALLNELLGQLGQEAVVAAAGLLVSADKKLAMEALSKVLGGPVSASSAAAPAGAAAAAAAPSRPGTAASTRGAPSRAGAGSRPGTARPAAAAPAAAAVAAPEAGGPILAYSEGKAERARKVRRCHYGGRANCLLALHVWSRFNCSQLLQPAFVQMAVPLLLDCSTAPAPAI